MYSVVDSGSEWYCGVTSVNRRVVGSSPTCGAKVLNLGRPKGLPISFMFWVYILENPKGTLYVGQTSDLPEKPLALMTWLN